MKGCNGARPPPIQFVQYLNSFNLNANDGTASPAFTDDLIIYVIDSNTKSAQVKLEKLFNLVAQFYNGWHLKIKALKSETIPIRKQCNFLSEKQRDGWRTFDTKIKDPTSNISTTIAHK